MWVILALHIVAMAIIAERVMVLYYKRKIGEKQFAAQFEKEIRRGDLHNVMTQLEQHKDQHAIARVMQAGTQAALNLGGKDEIQGKMDEILLEENARIEKRTGFLAMLANAGTLTGLLGTIVGMIKSFSAVTYASPVEKAALLSSGISEAMNTTAYGLIMAIPTLIMFSVLSNRGNELAEDLNQGSLKVFNWLSFTYEPITARTTTTTTGRRQGERSAVDEVNA